MSRYGAGKLRLWIGQPVNAPYATPPASLRAMLIFCILSVTGTLFFGVANQLAAGGTINYSNSEMAFFVLVHFLLPILIAHTIATNWPISRVLISIYALAITLRLIFLIVDLPPDAAHKAIAPVFLLASVCFFIWWLFVSLRVRLYYSLISGQGIPADIAPSTDQVLGTRRLERGFGKLTRAIAPYLEAAAVFIVFAAIYFGLALI